MKRNFTLAALICLLTMFSNTSNSQCLTGGSFTAGTTHTFNSNTEGFTGDFSWSSGGSGQLESSAINGTTTKVLRSATFTLPANATTLAWSYELGGTASVQSYVVEALYMDNGTINTVAVCSGGALTTTGANLSFAAMAPSQIIGQNFQLQITFTATVSGSTAVSKTLFVDNFRTNAFASQIILPVNFSYFNVSATNQGVLLTWLVSEEVNVGRYEVERSSNGKAFSKIASVNANSSVSYTYTDAGYSTGSNYYRIKAVDRDGKFKYSSVVLYKAGKKELSLRAFPVPAYNEVNLQHSTATSASLINILSADGKMIKSIRPTAGAVETIVDLTAFKPGLYIVQYESGSSEVETIKLVKK